MTARTRSRPSPKPTSVHRPEHRVVAQLLRELRLAAGLTQAQAAATVGITQAAVSEMETATRGMDLLVVRDLVNAYCADWPAFVVELDRRIAADLTPAAALIKGKPATK